MNLIDFLLLLVVAAIIGALGEAIGGYSPGSLAASIVVGFIGALVGGWIRAHLHMPEFLPLTVAHHQFSIVWSVIGAALFVFVLRLVTSRRTYIMR